MKKFLKYILRFLIDMIAIISIIFIFIILIMIIIIILIIIIPTLIISEFIKNKIHVTKKISK